MALKIPDSMDEVVYFTRRTLAEDKGKAVAWARKLSCPKCKKGRMGKPVDKGKIKIRALEYVCPACKYTEQKKEHEAQLHCEIIYDCPFPECKKHGEATVPFARKSFYGKKAIVFACVGCGEKLGITKKLATPADFVAKVEGKTVKPGKKEAVELDEDDDF